ncbi:MAG: S1 RNA-binding domain-containing protein [Alphaproteobacteria bacterium]|nr:S1 RNA-binding domain-containing protein [Alphaproteobacteria bacterium]
MSRPKVSRQRKADLRADRVEPSEADATPASTSAKPSAPAPAVAPRPRLDTDDLLALASMDPAELAALMEGAVRADALEVGEEVRGTVTAVTDQQILVDIGRKAEAWMERGDLPDVHVGQEVTAYVLHAEESGVRISTRLSGSAASAHLEEAEESGAPVEGHVASMNSGGFEVRIGDVRAFCPRSLISRHHVDAPEVFVGQTLQFKVIETGEKIVLSRRALEEERAEQMASTFWKSVEVGQQLDGVVRNVQPFGAFVDLGGVDGLIPKRELSWGDDSPADRVAVGEQVTVRVLEVDFERKKLTLSLKDPDQAPWRTVGSEFVEGGVYEGTVVRLTSFGAFVRLADGLDGLVHTSRLAAGVPKVGDALKVRVLALDHERQRISLAPFVEGTAEATAEEEVVSGTVAEVMRNGVVVQLDDGRTGWLPAGEVELPAGTMLAQRFRRGKQVQARVKDASRGSRLTLTMRQAAEEDWRAHAAPKKPESFGTFGDLFAGLNLKK